jgi:hypothetical protein
MVVPTFRPLKYTNVIAYGWLEIVSLRVLPYKWQYERLNVVVYIYIYNIKVKEIIKTNAIWKYCGRFEGAVYWFLS